MNFGDELSWADWADAMVSQGQSDVSGSDPRHVCGTCLADEGLAEAAATLAGARQCDFCGRRFRSERAVSIDLIAAYIMGCIAQDYDIPENVLFLDPESDNGWAGMTWDKWEIVQDHLSTEWEVAEAVSSILDDDRQWCERNPGQWLPSRQLGEAWESFSRYVKHSSRFMFLREDEQPRGYHDRQDDDFVPATAMLDLLGDAVRSAGLIRTLGTGTRIYRARAVGEGQPWHRSAADLGPPPESDNGPPAGRMNAAGIAIFYGALDPETPLHEALQSNGRVAMGVFSPLRPLRLLDLSGQAPLPYVGIFHNATRGQRGLAQFMSAFIDDIARISARDGREHIDYVPAQIVTEYFRRVFRIDDAALDGIIYPSTRSAQGRNIALFVQRDDIQGLSRWGETLRFRPRLSSFFNVTAVDGVVQGWDEVARSSL
ncbi:MULTISPECIES: HEPN-associated N-terminal domain-containing protein [Sphingobium]|uniref:RES family NAD+ phosphorylase n=2 Tax=Sphingobium limneticum TaxID=1007511 RepID=A0A5J5HS45_9SPHN|nr:MULTISPECIES: HEPN-associated N-terminal domain-containing protein [Sphingobium]KAA9011639.1 RES family NAD+ phosphorylase [Sphingobium limneticum]KAA9012259.1 RES family NAD+ phosphorylase [Sphingobium limneticum]KAA9024720.1 RES family NAD+ phosphorylase [Sphingobium limneticum]BBD03373.1 hypothetical protein YGS_C2P1387 [Sphingobium sp. YG1]